MPWLGSRDRLPPPGAGVIRRLRALMILHLALIWEQERFGMDGEDRPEKRFQEHMDRAHRYLNAVALDAGAKDSLTELMQADVDECKTQLDDLVEKFIQRPAKNFFHGEARPLFGRVTKERYKASFTKFRYEPRVSQDGGTDDLEALLVEDWDTRMMVSQLDRCFDFRPRLVAEIGSFPASPEPAVRLGTEEMSTDDGATAPR